MNTPLTSEQVKELRLPEGIELRNISSTKNPCWYWSATSAKDADPAFDTAQRHLATIAGWVANGDLPPAALDAVWAVAEGRVEYSKYLGVSRGSVKCQAEEATHITLQVKT